MTFFQSQGHRRDASQTTTQDPESAGKLSISKLWTSLFSNSPEPSTLQQAAPSLPDEHAGFELQGTELKYFPKPIPPQLEARFSDITILYSKTLANTILKKKRDSGNISMKLRYLGFDSQHNELYIVIQCEKRIAKNIEKFFAQKHVQEELSPDFRVFVLGKPPVEVSNDDAIDVLSGPLPSATMCGMPITLSGGGKSVSCTLGGVIIIETDRPRPFGLIAGHSLKRIRADLFGKKPTYEAYESSSSEEEWMDSDSDDISTNTSVMPSKSVHSDIEGMNGDDLLRTKLSIGTVVCDTSSVPSEINYDWALVDLNQEYALPNIVIRSQQSQQSDFQDYEEEIHSYYADSLDKAITKEVLVLKQDKPRMADLSLNTSSLMMSPGATFVSVHDVIMKDGSSFSPGDSGLWVVDAKTSGLYGHIVSVDAFGEAQVMPIQSTLESIKKKLKATRLLPATSLAIKQLKADMKKPYPSTLPESSDPVSKPTLGSIVHPNIKPSSIPKAKPSSHTALGLAILDRSSSSKIRHREINRPDNTIFSAYDQFKQIDPRQPELEEHERNFYRKNDISAQQWLQFNSHPTQGMFFDPFSIPQQKQEKQRLVVHTNNAPGGRVNP